MLKSEVPMCLGRGTSVQRGFNMSFGDKLSRPQYDLKQTVKASELCIPAVPFYH